MVNLFIISRIIQYIGYRIAKPLDIHCRWSAAIHIQGPTWIEMFVDEKCQLSGTHSCSLWFTIEEIPSGGGGNPPQKDPEEDPNKDPEEPSKPDEPIIIPGEIMEEKDIPLGDVLPTGDTTDILTPILLMLISLVGLFVVLRGKKENSEDTK